MLLKKALGIYSAVTLRIDDQVYLLVRTVSQVSHDDSEVHCLIWFRKKLLSVIWHERKVVEGTQIANKYRIWQGVVAVIDKPSCSIIVEISRNMIKEMLVICKWVCNSKAAEGSYCIHARNESIVSCRIVLCSDQKTTALRCREVDHFGIRLLRIYAINFHN